MSGIVHAGIERKMPVICIAVPCLDEEGTLPDTHSVLFAKLWELQEEGIIDSKSYILYVDDGSADSTWQTISSLCAVSNAKGMRLTRNFGQQEAILAALEYEVNHADAFVTIDADLQDDPEVIREMVLHYINGSDIVFGVRSDRDSDNWKKRVSARVFYKVMESLGASAIPNHADFRLMSRRAVEGLLEYGERNIFLRGIVPLLGYNQSAVYYSRRERKSGNTKYPLAKMLDFAAEGITSFSVRPVRMLFWIGMIFMLTAIGVFIYVMVRHFSGFTIEGWTSLMLSIWFCTGILLIGLGIIGEYIGKIYIESKHRPRYRVSERI